MSQRDYNEHYDATAAKGLCWEGDGNSQFVQDVTLPSGKRMKVKSLWCLDCAIQSGEIINEDAQIN